MNLSIPVLFENESFLVLDKPTGVLSIPSRRGTHLGEKTVFDFLEGRQVFIVHRLDFEASGLLLIAKDRDSHRAANSWFEKHQLCKAYEAWTEGCAPTHWQAGRIENWSTKILRGKRRAYESPVGKLAETEATWLGSVEISGFVLQHWKLNPRTGRPHQLRFELSSRGFPILGDKLYGSKLDFKPRAIALRAIELDFSKCENREKFRLPERLVATDYTSST